MQGCTTAQGRDAALHTGLLVAQIGALPGQDGKSGTNFSGYRFYPTDSIVPKSLYIKLSDGDGTICEGYPLLVKSNTGYSKRVNWIQKDTFVTLKGVVYDEAGELLKETHFSKFKNIDPAKGKWQAGLLEAKNVQTEHQTAIHIDDFQVNSGVKDELFTTRYMEQQ